MIWPLLRRLLFLADPEAAHDFSLTQIQRIQSTPALLSLVMRMGSARAPRLERNLWGLKFPNPFGIAAGFDKNAAMVPFLAALGFGFVETGTVTLRPQSGNARPRMFREPGSRAIVNRLGFNNAGAVEVRRSLDFVWSTGAGLPPVFVNIGKNRDVPNEKAPADYASTYRLLAPAADGVVVNVSSPNTPGLRQLQEGGSLRDILLALRSERERVRSLRGGDRPVLVKIAPDVDRDELETMAEICLQLADGMIATNTTLWRPDGWTLEQEGGLSGAPLLQRSTSVLQRLREIVGPGYPLIGVGGVMDGDDARLKLDAGADLVQAYTGFIYGGPAWPLGVVRRLAWWRDTEVR